MLVEETQVGPEVLDNDGLGLGTPAAGSPCTTALHEAIGRPRQRRHPMEPERHSAAASAGTTFTEGPRLRADLYILSQGKETAVQPKYELELGTWQEDTSPG